MNEKQTSALSDVKDLTEKAFDSLRKIQNFYDDPPAENEIDLVDIVREKLLDAGITEESILQSFDSNGFVREATGRHSHAQLWNLSRWLDEQLSLIQVQDGADTRLLRYQIMYEVPPMKWLTVFEKGILPSLVGYGLRYRGYVSPRDDNEQGT